MHIFERDLSKTDNIFIQKEAFERNENVHMHDFVEIVYIINGKGVQCVDGKEYPVRRGDVIFINYHQKHAFRVDGNMTFYNLFISPSFFDETMRDSRNIFDILTLTAFAEFRKDIMPEQLFLHFSGDEMLEVEQLFDNIAKEQNEARYGFRTLVRTYGTALFVYFFRKMLDSIAKDDGYVGIEEIARYVEENCSEKLSLKDLAEKCFYNPSYFSRAFKKKNGMNLVEFIHKSRIKKACTLLKDSDFSVEEISEMVGYHDKSGFYNKFKKIMGCLPTSYRKM